MSSGLCGELGNFLFPGIHPLGARGAGLSWCCPIPRGYGVTIQHSQRKGVGTGESGENTEIQQAGAGLVSGAFLLPKSLRTQLGGILTTTGFKPQWDFNNGILAKNSGILTMVF